MKLVFAYERLDGQYAVCQVKDYTDAYKTIDETNKIIIKNADEYDFSITASFNRDDYTDAILCFHLFSCSSVRFFDKCGEAWVRLQLPNTEDCVELCLQHFNTHIVSVSNSVTITTVTEYINCIEHIRLISLATHVVSLLTYELSYLSASELRSNTEELIKTLKDAIYFENKCMCTADLHKTDTKSNQILVEIEKYTKNPVNKTSTAYYEIQRSVKLYESGASFGYYRGVGHAIYPDVPSVFREPNKHEEDRWYRDMKTQFQNDLEKKPYLDRLGMLQHYELPTRMLDVTASPLVALYMTSNTIYTGDATQTDIGEIIVYYDGIVDEVNARNNHLLSLDSYGSDIAYIHDGKSYDSSIVLVLAALAKLKYENKERMRRVIITFKHLIDSKWGNDSVKYAAMLELVNRCFHSNGNCFEQHYCFTADELNSLSNTYSEFLCDRKFVRAEDICDILWEITGPDVTSSLPQDTYKSKEELLSEYLNCIPSYRYILSTVRRENPAFKDHINIFDLIKCFHVKMGRTNDRIQAQAGSFIICGLDPEYIKHHMLSSRTPGMVRFFVSKKKEIMRELNSLGINDSTMLPDMAHHAAYLKGRTLK